MTTKNRSGKPSGGRLPNDPLDWVADFSIGGRTGGRKCGTIERAPEAPAQTDDERNESMTESMKSGQVEGSTPS